MTEKEKKVRCSDCLHHWPQAQLKRFFIRSYASKESAWNRPLAISAHCWRRWWESLSVITLAQTSPCRPQVMPVDIDDTTKLSEEQRKFFSISTGSPSRRRRKTSTTFDLPYLPDQLRERLLSNERQAHTLQQMSQDSRRKVRRKQQIKEDLFPPSCSFFKFLFDRNVHRDGAIFLCTHSTWSWCSARLAHHTQWLGRGARNVLPIPESKLIAKALELDIDAYSGSLLDKVAWLRVHF